MSRQPRRLLFAWPAMRSAGRYFVLGIPVGVIILAVVTAIGGDASVEQTRAASEKLIGWRLELMSALPFWVAILLSNAMALLAVCYIGPLGCLAEMCLRRRSPLYDRLCKATTRHSGLLRRIHPGIRDLPEGPGRDGVAISYVVPVVFLFANGLVLGAVAVMFLYRHPSGLPGLLARLVPHGSVEVPALFLAGGLALTNADALAETARADEDVAAAAAQRIRSAAMALSVLILMTLLVAAAYIEGNITWLVMEWADQLMGVQPVP